MIQGIKKTAGIVLIFLAGLLLLPGCIGPYANNMGTGVTSTSITRNDATSIKAPNVVTGKYIKWESESSVVTNLTNAPVVVQGHSSDGADTLAWSIGLPPNGKRVVDAKSGPRLVAVSQGGIVLETIDTQSK